MSTGPKDSGAWRRDILPGLAGWEYRIPEALRPYGYLLMLINQISKWEGTPRE
jgi:hypothetical protein